MARPARCETLIELFLEMLAAERGGARNTLAAYGHDLADFSRYLESIHIRHPVVENYRVDRLSFERFDA